MARYMSMVKFSASAYAGTASEGPSARAQLLHSYAERMGAVIEGLWYTGGEWDMIMITNGELDAKALAGQWQALSTGAFHTVVNVPIFEPDEFQAGFDASDIPEYRAPGQN